MSSIVHCSESPSRPRPSPVFFPFSIDSSFPSHYSLRWYWSSFLGVMPPSYPLFSSSQTNFLDVTRFRAGRTRALLLSVAGAVQPPSVCRCNRCSCVIRGRSPPIAIRYRYRVTAVVTTAFRRYKSKRSHETDAQRRIRPYIRRYYELMVCTCYILCMCTRKNNYTTAGFSYVNLYPVGEDIASITVTRG